MDIIQILVITLGIVMVARGSFLLFVKRLPAQIDTLPKLSEPHQTTVYRVASILEKNSTKITSISESPVVDEVDESDSFKKGKDFEKYVMKKFHDKPGFFEVHDYRHDQPRLDGKPLRANSNPDLEIEAFIRGGSRTKIAVECKFRSNWDTNYSVEWCKEHNLENYRKFSKDRNIPVFVALGVGGDPSSPSEMFCFKITPKTSTRVNKQDMNKLKQSRYLGFYYDFKDNELLYKGSAV